MSSALKENTHCFMPLCGFQVQTLLRKCEHQMCCLNVFKTWLLKALKKKKNLHRDTVWQREIKQNQTQKTEKNACHVSVSKA